MLNTFFPVHILVIHADRRLKPHSLTESRHRISLRSMVGLQEWEADMQAAEPKLFALSAHSQSRLRRGYMPKKDHFRAERPQNTSHHFFLNA